MAERYPVLAFEDVVAYAKAQDDGTAATSSEFRNGKPRTVVLVATTPERAALLHAIHEAWYPEDGAGRGDTRMSARWHDLTADEQRRVRRLLTPDPEDNLDDLLARMKRAQEIIEESRAREREDTLATRSAES